MKYAIQMPKYAVYLDNKRCLKIRAATPTSAKAIAEERHGKGSVIRVIRA